MVEQVVLAPLVVGRSLRWTTLPFHHNSTMISALPYNAEHFRDARIVHYHDSMSPRHWETFLRHAEVEHPDAAEWLRDRGPVTSPSSTPARAVAEFYRLARGARRRIDVALDRGDRSVG